VVHCLPGGAAEPRVAADSLALAAERDIVRRRHVISARIGFLVALLTLVEPACKGPAPTLSQAQVTELAKEIASHTPERLHCARTTVLWVLLASDASDPFPDVTSEVRARLGERYTVYSTESAVPAEYRRLGDLSHVYDCGFVFSFRVRVLGKNRVEVSYSDYEGPRAGSDQVIQYGWKGTRWVITVSGPLRVF
jgi:hypothetical protein